MPQESWVLTIIEKELIPYAEKIEDIIANGRINSMSDDEVHASIDEAIVHVNDITTITDNFLNGFGLGSALQKGLLADFEERHKNDIDIIQLYCHDCHNTSYNTMTVKNVGGRPKVAFSFIHTLINTIFTSAYLLSQNQQYLKQLNISTSLESLKSKHKNTTINISNNPPAFDTSLYTLILNLVKNADNGKSNLVTISASNLEPQYSVKDDGVGIDKDALSLIFGEYSTSGGGLGLKIIRRIIDLKGASIKVYSTVEGKPTYTYDTTSKKLKQVEQQPKGTTFVLYLPS